MKNKDNLTTYVQYEIYNSNNFERLNLSVCNETDIIINIPSELNSEIISLYESLDEYGYNLFDSNDSFYNDICTPYTSLNNTDIILLDRKKFIYTNHGNLTLCQNNCSITEYISVYKNVVCKCSVQEDSKEVDLDNLDLEFNFHTISKSFYNTIKNSNFLVLKCYKLVFNYKYMTRNIGLILMAILLLMEIALIFIYFLKEQKKINLFIITILKLNYYSNKKEKVSKKLIKVKSKVINTERNNKIKKKKIKKAKIGKESNTIIFQTQIKSKTSNKKNKLNPPKKNNNSNSKNIKIDRSKTLINNNESASNNSSHKFIKVERFHNINSVKFDNFIKNNHLTEQELNTLNYEDAIEKDKRTYFQFYWSLLKKKHLILFTFLPAEEYNLITIKISLFLISFSLNFTINGFFFSDETMHKIYEDNGVFDFLYQLAQILYSSFIFIFINIILKLLSLSESNILDLKKIKNRKEAINESNKTKKYIKIKSIIFFIIVILLLLFCWYFISCFCIVYNNTQIILISDTLLSFCLSMMYPFGQCLLPGWFRIPALRAVKKDRKILYRVSLLISLFV